MRPNKPLKLTAAGFCRAGGLRQVESWEDHSRSQLSAHPFGELEAFGLWGSHVTSVNDFMAHLRMRCAILTIAYYKSGIFPGEVIIVEHGKLYVIDPFFL
jgi:hypothetical protein